MDSQVFFSLPSGQKMPALGLGTFLATNDGELESAVETAIELGYRHIDTAFVYNTEISLGKALKKLISSGKIKREDLFITTKLPMEGIHPERVEMFIKKSLKNLQLDYVDLYLIHFTVGLKYKEGIGTYNNENGDVATEGRTDHIAIWRKMEEQVEAGRARNIGLSNYTIPLISKIMETARIKPGNLQIENHVFFQQRELVEFCQKNGITVTGYCPLANPSFNDFLEKIGLERRQIPNIFVNPVVIKLGEKYNKTPAQIALRFLVQRGIAAIPKSVVQNEIEENSKIFDFTISENDMKVLYDLQMGEPGRLADFKLTKGIEKHPDYPFPK